MATRAMVLTLGETLFSVEQYRHGVFQHLANDLASRLRLDSEGLYWALREIIDLRIDEEPERFLSQFVKQENLPQAELQRLVQRVRDYQPMDLSLYPSARKFLEYARDHVKLALIVPGHGVVQRNIVRALGLAAEFDFVVCLSDHGEVWRNSGQLAYLAIQDRFRVRPGQMLAISGNARRDFPGPRAIGVPCARVRHRGRDEGGAGELLMDVDSLLDILAQPMVMANGGNFPPVPAKRLADALPLALRRFVPATSPDR